MDVWCEDLSSGYYHWNYLQMNVVFNSLPFWVSAIYFPVKQREKKKKVLARRRGKGKAKRGKKGTK